MTDNELNKYEGDEQNFEEVSESTEPSKKKTYFKASYIGLGVSVLVGVLLAIIAYVSEKEYIYALIIGAVVISSTIGHFVPRCSTIGALLGAVFTPLGYLIYYFLMKHFGYDYEGYSERWFYALIILSAGLGALLGYNAFKKEDE